MLKKLCVIILCLLVVIAGFGCKKKPREYRVFTSYNIEAEIDTDKMQLSAKMSVNYKNITDKELVNIKFNLYPNSFREGAAKPAVSPLYEASAYPEGKSYGAIHISSVSQDNVPCEFSIEGSDENILNALFNKGLFPGEDTEIVIEFQLSIARTNHRIGYNQKTINLGHWYPSVCVNTNAGWYENENQSWGDPFYSEASDYQVSLSIKSSYTAAATGAVTGTSDSQKPGYTTYHFSAQKVRDFAFVLSEDFNVATAEFGGTKIMYYYLSDEEAQETLKLSKLALEYFSKSFGAFTQPQYSIVETPFYHSGAEFSNLVMISDSNDRQEFNYTLVHETAHQWWYSIIGVNESENGWIDEGLSELSAVMFFENFSDYNINAKKKIDNAYSMYREFFSIASQLDKKADTSMHRALHEYANEFEYINITYNKSLIMLNTARTTLGSKKFEAALKNMVKEYAWHNIAPEDFIGFFEKTRLNTTKYFYAWIEGKVLV